MLVLGVAWVGCIWFVLRLVWILLGGLITDCCLLAGYVIVCYGLVLWFTVGLLCGFRWSLCCLLFECCTILFWLLEFGACLVFC